MARMKTLRSRLWILGVLLTAGLANPAAGLYLDEDQDVSLRARVYSQASIRTTNSQGDTTPVAKAGQLVQQRNFFNPELEAKLTSYTTWMKDSWLSFVAPDDFSGRLAAWGFYDGIYDYGSSQFGRSAGQVNADYPDVTKRAGAFYLEGPSFNPKGRSINALFPGVEVQNPHDVYATRQRINELYFNYGKGPFFLRVGKQAISWGESDTIAILDQNNPFDFTLAAPGVFEDLDEARIPLWTVRTSYTVPDFIPGLSSSFVEAYWVPGDLDVNTGILPVLTASPYSVPRKDPQSLVQQVGGGLVTAQFVLFDHVPQKRFGSSRYGFRTQTIVNRTYTLSAWFYTAFPSTPVPISHGITAGVFTVETVHDKLTPVFGVGNTFFLEPLDGIVRMEAEYFNREPAFIPDINLGVNKNTATTAGALGVLTNCSNEKCRTARASYLRWELGFDRFFFLRPVNPTNSFTWVTALVGSWNLDETSQKDFRYAGQTKPGTTGNSPDDFVQQKKVETFAQTHLQTDYMHGRLSPSATVILNLRGTYALLPAVTYRWTDWLLFDLSLIHIGGAFEGLGFFRDRNQVSLRATYQLN
jgi:hypothetical protein